MSSGMEALYPFLYDEPQGLDAVLEAVRRSTEEKAAEIVAVRRVVAERFGEQLEACARAMAERFSAGGRLLTFGNGGSSTDAAAVAGAFLAGGENGRPLPALTLTADVAVLTALGNDVGFDVVFARQVAAMGRPGDIALAVSTSGGSENVIRALEEAKRRGLLTIGLAGYDGGRMGEADLDFLFAVPSSSVHRIQEAQTTLYHVLWSLVQAELAGGGT
ncbi:MAG TPA: SIS domain-containing protein [Acidimicrobiia bacterium]|nr:SIS domain-containing protein [Acidimicrobiia bacterium]